ncbi:hypothetical protein [Virgibacillus doumboii]|uniref:hypothetical protein n=1 Tax=Virgibacillus doumboii TaxID=2697503 RepID=UPI0013DFE961|nr:hypothetical protein [Virgibacillus doumboii]
MMDLRKNVQETEKKKFANTLSGLADQLRLIDQKITMSTDSDIQQNFYNLKREIDGLNSTVKKISRKRMKNTKKIILPNFTFNARKRSS